MAEAARPQTDEHETGVVGLQGLLDALAKGWDVLGREGRLCLLHGFQEGAHNGLGLSGAR